MKHQHWVPIATTALCTVITVMAPPLSHTPALPLRQCASAIESNAGISRGQLDWVQNRQGTNRQAIETRIGQPYCWLLPREQNTYEAFYPFKFDPDHGFIVIYRFNVKTVHHEMSGFDFANTP